jgi:hypothetical protein
MLGDICLSLLKELLLKFQIMKALLKLSVFSLISMGLIFGHSILHFL